MRTKSWQEPCFVDHNYTNYYRVSQTGAQVTNHICFETVLTRVEYLLTRSDAPIQIDYTDDSGRTFRFVSGLAAEAFKQVLTATA